MRVILIGSTGATGKCLVKELLADKEVSKIILLNRRKYFGNQEKLKEIIVDFENLKDYTAEFQADKAISCLGTTLKAAGSKENQWKIEVDYQVEFARLAKENGIVTFSLISSFGANPKAKIFYQRMKGEIEEKIKALHFENLQIFRPPSLIRPNSDRTGERLGVSLISFLNKLGILKNLKPLSVKDLAKVMLMKLKNANSGIEVFNPQQIHKIKKTD